MAAVIVRKKFSRSQLLAYTANLPCSLIGMEACSGAHFLGAKLREQGHDVRLIPAQFVKPYVKSNKNDFIDDKGRASPYQPFAHAMPIRSEDSCWSAVWCLRNGRRTCAGGCRSCWKMPMRISRRVCVGC